MAYSRRLGVVSILSACWLVAVGCNDDEDRKPNAGDAGEGGDDDGGGKAGTPSVGGNMSQGGKAGMPGGGMAGAASAGEAGSGVGGSGEAGSGGIVAGAGGEGGAGATGGGGEGGLESGGAGGEGGAPIAVAKSCVDVCESDDDCVDGGGFPKNCNDVTKICEACAADADCAPEPSQWVPGCETTEECGDPLFVCVNYRGNAYCAVLDDPQNGAGCADLGEFVATTATLRDGGAETSVCIAPNFRCFDGKCEQSCEALDMCPADEGDTCNPVSGRCECQNSTECGEGLVCVDNLCTECAVDADCASNVFGNDTCVAGKCGCTAATSCATDLFPNATEACQ